MSRPSTARSRSSSFFTTACLALIWAFGGAIALAPVASADFNYEVYDGSFNELPDFSTLTPIDTGTSSTISLGVTSQTDTFALVSEIQINVPTAGDYEFFTNSDDGSILYIDGGIVVDNDGLHGPVNVAGSAGGDPAMHFAGRGIDGRHPLAAFAGDELPADIHRAVAEVRIAHADRSA